jgi:hypothetical protein
MLRVAIKLGAFPMPGVGAVPAEGMEGFKAELARAHVEVQQYARKAFGSRVTRRWRPEALLPNAAVTAVAVTRVLPSSRPTFRPPSPRPDRLTWSSSKTAASGWYGDDLTENWRSDLYELLPL